VSILDRDALGDSPLADLHTIASELSIDGYRRLRKEQLIDAILARQGGSEPEDAEAEDESPPAPRRRGRRGGRGRGRDEGEQAEPAEPAEPAEQAEQAEQAEPVSDDGNVVEGLVDVLANGSGFLRVTEGEESADDVYISAAQVRRCELITGDRISGPRRAPRRSERFASLYRVDAINGRPAEEVADRPRFDDVPAAFPDERLELGSDDPTLEAIGRLTPIGKGSRVTIVGPARAGKSETLKRLATRLHGQEGLEVLVVLAGVRPEEISDWPMDASQAVSLAASPEVQEQAITSGIDRGRRVAVRGADAVVLIDTLTGLDPHAARRALAAARNLRDGASLTVIATAAKPLGGETTVIALDPARTARGEFPSIELSASGTLKPELLVGEDGASVIATARAAQ